MNHKQKVLVKLQPYRDMKITFGCELMRPTVSYIGRYCGLDIQGKILVRTPTGKIVTWNISFDRLTVLGHIPDLQTLLRFCVSKKYHVTLLENLHIHTPVDEDMESKTATVFLDTPFHLIPDEHEMWKELYDVLNTT